MGMQRLAALTLLGYHLFPFTQLQTSQAGRPRTPIGPAPFGPVVVAGHLHVRYRIKAAQSAE